MTVQHDLLAAGLLTPDGLLTPAGRQRVDELLGPPTPRERNRWQHEQHGPALRVAKKRTAVMGAAIDHDVMRAERGVAEG